MGWVPVQVGTTAAQRARGYTEAWTAWNSATDEWAPGEAVTSRAGAVRMIATMPDNTARAEALNSLAIRQWAEELTAR